MDSSLLKFLYDDNQKVEPEWYIPIIPMVLVNGAEGIGTGWACKIPNYDPREIVNNINRMLNNQDPLPMVTPHPHSFTNYFLFNRNVTALNFHVTIIIKPYITVSTIFYFKSGPGHLQHECVRLPMFAAFSYFSCTEIVCYAC